MIQYMAVKAKREAMVAAEYHAEEDAKAARLATIEAAPYQVRMVQLSGRVTTLCGCQTRQEARDVVIRALHDLERDWLVTSDRMASDLQADLPWGSGLIEGMGRVTIKVTRK